jgi:hypothetical protein
VVPLYHEAQLWHNDAQHQAPDSPCCRKERPRLGEVRPNRNPDAAAAGAGPWSWDPRRQTGESSRSASGVAPFHGELASAAAEDPGQPLALPVVNRHLDGRLASLPARFRSRNRDTE